MPDDWDPARAFFDGAGCGVLLVQHCAQCGAYQFPFSGISTAVAFCRNCLARRPPWIPATGAGQVVSYTGLPRRRGAGAGDLRYSGIVQLAEGPWVYAEIALSPPELDIGVCVRVRFERRSAVDPRMPVFGWE